MWLANAKCATYTADDINSARDTVREALAGLESGRTDDAWIPPLKEVEKWWEPSLLALLAALFRHIREADITPRARDLLLIIFCRVAIEVAAVSFGHQSMSFKRRAEPLRLFDPAPYERLHAVVRRFATSILASAADTTPEGYGQALVGDARHRRDALPRVDYTTVITSPPYPNRMSYIRELRPYRYWLGHLNTGRQAGELDWQAIGGTWGCATSNLTTWKPDREQPIPSAAYEEAVVGIMRRSSILGTYVMKYFYDLVLHVQSLRHVLAPDARVQYVVGNSKFYDVMLHTEQIYAAILRDQGFQDVEVRTIRKRTSKKEPFEFIVSATA